MERHLYENTKKNGMIFFEDQPVMRLGKEGEAFVDRRAPSHEALPPGCAGLISGETSRSDSGPSYGLLTPRPGRSFLPGRKIR